MTLVLLIIQIILAFCLILIVLLQRTGDEGWSGLTSGSSGSGLMSKRSTANFFTRTTTVLAALFMINSIVLANVVPKKNQSTIIKELEKDLEAEKEHSKTKHPHKHKNPSIPLAE